MTTYFVSSILGSDMNAGLSPGGSFASLQAAEALVNPGDTVEVMNGTYTGPGGGNVLTISTNGKASAPITFEAAPGAKPIIDSSGTWQGIEVNASYITIKGFTIVGDAKTFNLSSALAGYSTGNPNLDGNGIAATSGTHIHNIIIENNAISDEPGGGIAINNSDYLQILNNNVHDNAHWSAFGTSGISVGASQNFDTGPGPHIIISGNTSVNNTELVPEFRAGAITDGEGIILDSNGGYTGGFLVENNTTHGNSGPGIESFFSDNAAIKGNIASGNLTNPSLVSEGEIFINQSNNNIVTNGMATVPELSTWVMLLIGFVGIKYLSYRLGITRKTLAFEPALRRIALVRRARRLAGSVRT
jgi:parallel beta-helix repeat protein